jgi:hypothetical protein
VKICPVAMEQNADFWGGGGVFENKMVEKCLDPMAKK